MRKTIKSLLVIALIFSGLNLSAQGGSKSHINYERNTGWYLGMNMGGSYQNKKLGEIDRYAGVAGGLTLGHDWLTKDKFLGWGLRYRLLAGATYGLDKHVDSVNLHNISAYNGGGDPALNYSANEGMMLHNYRNVFIDNSLELTLHLNRLRQETGIILSGFGGIGLTSYVTETNQLDEFGDRYQVDPNKEYTISDIRSFGFNEFDNSFESYAAGNDGPTTDWMASAGFEFGFQLAPWAALTFTHRHTWTRNNAYDGQVYNSNGEISGKNDGYFYSGLSLTFNFHKGNGGHIEPRPVNNNATTTIVPRKKPVVNITDPYSNPHTVNTWAFNLKANIFHVDGAHQITFKQNGAENLNFTYYPASNKFSSDVVLKPGQNVFEIRATNEVGSDYESRVIIWKDPVTVNAPAPIVSITNPSYCPFVVNNATYTVTANIFNVANKSGVTFKVNGVTQSNFNYTASNNYFNAFLNLKEGNNIIEIIGANNVGSDNKTCNIIYEKPVEQNCTPVVTILSPNLNPFTTQSSSSTVTASLQNVDNQGQINVKVNGLNVSNFNYNSSNGILTVNSNLNQGNNLFEVTVTKNCGVAYDATTIVYDKPNVQLPPVVTFLDPAYSPLTVYNNLYNVEVQILNITNSNQITLKINGISTSAFNYSLSSKLLNLNTSLVPGANVFEVTATNTAGSDYAATTIVYVEPQPQLPPVVTITNPSTSPYVVNSPQGVVIGTVLNVGGINDISVKVNGVNTGNFTYNQNTKVVSVSSNLVLGNNVFAITGTNPFGTASDNTTIVYEQLSNPQPPTVNITVPSANPHLVNQPHVNVTAQVQNITTQNQIQVKLNGGNVNNFTFNALAQQVVITGLIMNQGNNLVEVIVTNPDGTASDNTTINYQPITAPCDAPTLSINQPQSNPFNYTNSSAAFTVQATLTNIQSSNQIEVKLNGNYLSAFNFSNGNLSIPITLTNGNNVVEIRAENTCNKAHGSVVIVYTPEQLPCNKPTVSISSPLNGTSTIVNTVALSALVNGVNSQADISLKLNGQSASFTYDPATHLVTASLSLIIGNNSIEIVGTNACGNTSAQITIVLAPCNQPAIVITAPLPNIQTTDASITFSANVQNVSSASDLQLFVNGNQVSFNFTNGLVTSTVNLNVGSNNIKLKASNQCGNIDGQITVVRDNCNPPTLNIVKPAVNPFNTTDNNIHIKAYATNALQNEISVTLNGNPSAFQYEVNTGKIIYTNTLVDGANTILIKVTNNCGSIEESIIVNYAPEVITPVLTPPVVTITSPATHPHASSLPTYTVQGSVTNIASKTNMSVTVDGTNTSNFTFNPANGQFNIPLTLSNGSNVNVVVSASNSDGSHSDATSVTYTLSGGTIGGGKPSIGNPPVITWITPQGGTGNASSPNYTLSASITHVQNASQVTLTQQNAAVTNFTLNNGVLTANVTLVDGTNTFNITATNNDGSDQAVGTVAYTAPPVVTNPPVITWINPQGGSGTSTTENYTLSASITHVQNASQVTLTHQNAAVPNFTLNNGVLTANVTLIDGTNTFNITATNNDGSDQATGTVAYSAPPAGNPPVITWINPSGGSDNSTAASYTISANVTEVTGLNEINLTHNGNVVSTASFNNGVLQYTAILDNGANVFNITATNNFGNDQETGTITYNPVPAGPCGPRFNPGNSDWQFCLITPQGTFNRDDLANNSGFTYSGSASSAYFKPIAGGGDAVVNGQPYALSNGQYYLFTGNLTVDVSSSHPGSMGHWEICITSNSTPTYGNGNNRPTSPCESSNGVGNGNSSALVPVITIASQTWNATNTNTNTYEVKGTISNISSASQISATVNGTSISSINYDPGRTTFQFIAPLTEGANIITVIATNNNGSDEESTTINYTAPSGMQLNGGIGNGNTQGNDNKVENEKKYQSHISEGDKFYQAKDYKNANASYTKALAVEGKANDSYAKSQLDKIKNAEKAIKDKAEADRLKNEQEAKQKAEAERLKNEQAAKQKAEQERLRKEQEAKQRAEADRLKNEQAAKQKAEQERLRKEQEAKQKAEAERLKNEQAAKQKAEQERLRKEQEAKQRAEADRLKNEQAAKQKAEQERLRKEQEAKQRAEQERLRKEQEAKQRAEADRKRKEAEARQKTEAERKRKEAEARQRAEAERKRKEAEAANAKAAAAAKQKAAADAAAKKKAADAAAKKKAEDEKKAKEAEAAKKKATPKLTPR